MSKRRMKAAYDAAEPYRAFFEREFDKRFFRILRGGFWKRLLWRIFPKLKAKAQLAADPKWREAKAAYVERSLKALAHRAATITRTEAKEANRGRRKDV